MPFTVRQITDPVIGQLRDVGVFKRRAALNVHTKEREVFCGHADDRHVADDNRLYPSLLLLALPIA
jgi:hypothetical protein